MTVRGAYLLLRGVPFWASTDDIFFWLYRGGLDCVSIDNIERCFTRRRFNGRVVIHCDSAEGAVEAARNLHVTKFWYRYVECYPCVDVDAEFSALNPPRDEQE